MEYIERYGAWLADAGEVSPRTREAYLRDVRQFAQWLSAAGAPLREARPEHLSRYAAHLAALGKKPSTLARVRASLRSFFMFMEDNGHIPASPARELAAAAGKRALPQILTSGEVERLLDQPAGEDRKSVRDKAMLELLYATGIRASELIALDLADVDIPLEVLRCRGGGRDRTIPLHRRAAEALDAYIRLIRPQLLADPADPALFVSMAGRRMSRQGFWKLVREYGAAAGIQKEITPNLLRQSFAAHLLEGGADLKSVQEMLGHTDPASTRFYAQLADRKLKETYRSSHPRAGEGPGRKRKAVR